MGKREKTLRISKLIHDGELSIYCVSLDEQGNAKGFKVTGWISDGYYGTFTTTNLTRDISHVDEVYLYDGLPYVEYDGNCAFGFSIEEAKQCFIDHLTETIQTRQEVIDNCTRKINLIKGI